ncbi:MAG: response regulator transcription factor [Eubacterium sp.]|nr:response regulator transcription factor [Eubacterium sp.]
MKILYAEDEKQLSMAVAEILKIEGYQVELAEDGEEAWEHLVQNDYDAVILDIMMPKMSGMEVLEKMRENSDFTPTILLTAKAQTEDRINGLSAGADDYLAKPFEMGELLARLGALIRRSNQYRTKILRKGNIELDCETNEVRTTMSGLRLSSKEAEMLALFMKSEDVSYTLDELRDKLWENENDLETVKLYLSYLKTKLKQLHADITIEEDGGGYRCVVSATK